MMSKSGISIENFRPLCNFNVKTVMSRLIKRRKKKSKDINFSQMAVCIYYYFFNDNLEII